MNETTLDESDAVPIAQSISHVLKTGQVTPSQAEKLQAACKGLEFLSVGIHVKPFGTVICTDCLLKPGFVDLSLCPVHLSLAGSVISRRQVFHDNLSVHSSGVPLDVARIVQRYGVKSAVYVPIKLPAVTIQNTALASEQVLGTIGFASCQIGGATAGHRQFAEDVASALALDFADATSNIFNNVTDYVLGPMHGHPYPATSDRPVPTEPPSPQEGCRPSSFDSDDQDPSCSALLHSSEDDRDNSPEPELSPAPAADPPLSREASEELAARLDEQTKMLKQSLDRPTHLKGGSGFFGEDTNASQHDASQNPQPIGLLGEAEGHELAGGTLRNRRHRTSGLRDSVDSSTSMTDRKDLEGPSEHVSEVELTSSDEEPVNSSFTFGLPLSWIKRPKSDDSAHEDPNVASKRRLQNALRSRKASHQTSSLRRKAVSYQQHSVMLNFKDARIERQFCAWQAKQRTWVQLCYSLMILSLGSAVCCVTSSSQRSSLLWWSPLLQLVPLMVVVLQPQWYYAHSEAMHIALALTKTAWAVYAGVPHLARFGAPSRHAAVIWSFCLNALMLSCLGELARFSTFVWVEALKLIMIAAASKSLCAAHVDAVVSMQHCTSLVFASQFAVTYVLAGGYVWCLDKQARQQFVHGRLRQSP